MSFTLVSSRFLCYSVICTADVHHTYKLESHSSRGAIFTFEPLKIVLTPHGAMSRALISSWSKWCRFIAWLGRSLLLLVFLSYHLRCTAVSSLLAVKRGTIAGVRRSSRVGVDAIIERSQSYAVQ